MCCQILVGSGQSDSFCPVSCFFRSRARICNLDFRLRTFYTIILILDYWMSLLAYYQRFYFRTLNYEGKLSSTLLPAEVEAASLISFTGDVGRNLTSLNWMLSFLRTRINAKQIDSVIKIASFDSVKQFRNQSGKVNLFTESILHLI